MLRACRCGGRISNGVCDACGPIRDTRPSSNERGYDNEWRKAADAWLRRHPLCVCCVAMGKINGERGRTGLRVDHIVPQRMAPELFWVRSNWQSLCLDCDLTHKQPIEKSCERPEQILERWAALLARLATSCSLPA